MFNVVEFRWGVNAERRRLLHVLVDGHDLAEWIRPIEEPFAQIEKEPGEETSLAGRYAGVLERDLDRRPLRTHFLGGAGSHLFCGNHDKTVLLTCTCGEAGCWPLMAKVVAAEGQVTWSDFENPFRKDSWSYAALAPFTFERGQYDAALKTAEDTAP